MRKDGWIGGGAVRVGWGSSGEGEQGFFYTGEQGFKMAAFHCILLRVSLVDSKPPLKPS
jgi:hypothetical protein